MSMKFRAVITTTVDVDVLAYIKRNDLASDIGADALMEYILTDLQTDAQTVLDTPKWQGMSDVAACQIRKA